jgi:hypothetical protein
MLRTFEVKFQPPGEEEEEEEDEAKQNTKKGKCSQNVRHTKCSSSPGCSFKYHHKMQQIHKPSQIQVITECNRHQIFLL